MTDLSASSTNLVLEQSHTMAPRQHHHDEFEANQFLGKELKNFSQAGFDLDRIHIKVSVQSAALP